MISRRGAGRIFWSWEETGAATLVDARLGENVEFAGRPRKALGGMAVRDQSDAVATKSSLGDFGERARLAACASRLQADSAGRRWQCLRC